MKRCRANSKWHLGRAVRVLRAGGIVAHATEGVWGLACDPGCEVAVGRLLRVKRRPVHKGLILIGARADVFTQELAELSAVERSTVCASWPGAVTWLLPNRQFAYWVTGGREAVAVRVPGHGQARALCRAFGGPLVSTSANISGRPAAHSELMARRSIRTGVDYFLPGEVAFAGGPSEIRTLSGRRLRGAGQ